MKKSFVRGTWQVKRAFSPVVITEGAGRILWIAGHTGPVKVLFLAPELVVRGSTGPV